MWELLIVLAIVLVIFGPKRLKTIGSDIGNAIKGFRKAVSDEDKSPPPVDRDVIEGKVGEEQQSKQKHDTNV
jgi:sec-independent protein translocase protein TatA